MREDWALILTIGIVFSITLYLLLNLPVYSW
jgi:hypothetical protein